MLIFIDNGDYSYRVKIICLLLMTVTILSSRAKPTQTNPNLWVQELMDQASEIANPNEAKRILLAARSVENSISDSLKCAWYVELGIAYGKIYALDSSRFYFEEVLGIADAMPWHILKIRAYNGLGNAARSESNNDQAMEVYSKGLEIASQYPEQIYRIWECMLYGAMAGIYYDLGDLPKALKVMQKSLDLGFELNDESLIATNYTRMGYLYAALGQPDLSIENTLKAGPYLEAMQDTLGLIYHYQSLGGTYMLMERWVEALDSFHLCLTLSESFSEEEIKTGTYIQMGDIYLKMKNYKEVNRLAKEALDLAKQYNLAGKRRDALELLMAAAREQNLLSLAFVYNDLYQAIKDSISNVEIQNRINELNTKYETEKQEREINALQSKNQLAEAELARKRANQILLVAVIAMLICGGVFVFISQRQKRKLSEQAMLGEMAELRIQIKELHGKYVTQPEMSLSALNQKLVTPLSEREFEIFKQIFTQKTNREIAEEVFVSVNTVKTHLKNIYSKLGVSNRKEALEIARK